MPITRRKSENAVRCSIYVSARALEVELLGTAPPASRTSQSTSPSPSFFCLPVAAEYSTKQKIADSHRVAAAAVVVVVIFIAMIMIIINVVIIAIAIHLNK